jgi:hypothetical protein
MPLSIFTSCVALSSSIITIHSHDHQSFLRSTLSKDTTSKTKEPTFICSKQAIAQLSPPTPQQIAHLTRHNPINWKIALHNFVATSQWRSKWSINSPQILHRQNHSIAIIFIFRKLSKVNIFPKAVVHTKNTSWESLNFPDTIPRKNLR